MINKLMELKEKIDVLYMVKTNPERVMIFNIKSFLKTFFCWCSIKSTSSLQQSLRLRSIPPKSLNWQAMEQGLTLVVVVCLLVYFIYFWQPVLGLYCYDKTSWSKKLGWERVYFSLSVLIPVHPERKSGQDLEARTEAETGWLLMSFSACFLNKPQDHLPGMTSPTVGWALPYQH